MVDEHLESCQTTMDGTKRNDYLQFVVFISIDLGGTTSVG